MYEQKPSQVSCFYLSLSLTFTSSPLNWALKKDKTTATTPWQERRRLDSQKDDVSLTEQDKEELQFARESIERQRREHFACNFCRKAFGATSLDKDRCAHQQWKIMWDEKEWPKAYRLLYRWLETKNLLNNCSNQSCVLRHSSHGNHATQTDTFWREGRTTNYISNQIFTSQSFLQVTI